MSEQYEPSYYEIALTGRQVLVAFVILLICLVAAFFSGVWVGREEAGGDRAGETVAEASDELVPETGTASETAPSADEGEGVEELSFFEEEPAPAPAEPGGDRPESRSESGPESGPESGQTRAPGSRAESRADRPGDAPAPESASGPSGERAPAGQPANPRQTVNPSGALAGGDLVVQVLSSSDQAAAEKLVDRLRAGGYRVFISPVVDQGETFYRVRVGPFEHRDDAERVETELRTRYDLDTWITR